MEVITRIGESRHAEVVLLSVPAVLGGQGEACSILPSAMQVYISFLLLKNPSLSGLLKQVGELRLLEFVLIYNQPLPRGTGAGPCDSR